MKQDRYFKYLAATLLVGVVLAFVQPTQAVTTNHAEAAAPESPAGK
jgi:hypothetical protein